MRKLSFGYAATGMAMLVWACSTEGADDAMHDATAGRGGDAGSAGTSSGGSGGGGAAGDTLFPDQSWCGPFPLASLCELPSMPCPTSPEALCPSCDSKSLPCPFPAEAQRFETACGGFVVVQDFDLGSESWEFDKNGKLISVLVGSDAVVECETGGFSASTLYGAPPCEHVAQETPGFCSGSGGAGGGGGEGAGGAAGNGGGGAGEAGAGGQSM